MGLRSNFGYPIEGGPLPCSFPAPCSSAPCSFPREMRCKTGYSQPANQPANQQALPSKLLPKGEQAGRCDSTAKGR